MCAFACSHCPAVILYARWNVRAEEMLLLKRRALPSTTYISSQTRDQITSHSLLTHRQGRHLSPTSPQLCSYILHAV